LRIERERYRYSKYSGSFGDASEWAGADLLLEYGAIYAVHAGWRDG
jgi:hypothetical protein